MASEVSLDSAAVRTTEVSGELANSQHMENTRRKISAAGRGSIKWKISGGVPLGGPRVPGFGVKGQNLRNTFRRPDFFGGGLCPELSLLGGDPWGPRRTHGHVRGWEIPLATQKLSTGPVNRIYCGIYLVFHSSSVRNRPGYLRVLFLSPKTTGTKLIHIFFAPELKKLVEASR